MYVDGVIFSMRIGASVGRVPVLVSIGVSRPGHRLAMDLQSVDKESASICREFFKDLKSCGLLSHNIALGTMDGLPGLEKVFKEEFPNARIQHCQLHMSRNVLVKVSRKLKKTVADDLCSIFYALKNDKVFHFSTVLLDSGNTI
jgi:putative transposase